MAESTAGVADNGVLPQSRASYRPRVLFLDFSDGSYWEARKAVLKELGLTNAVTLLKSGSVLPAPSDTQSAHYGPYQKGLGRTMVTASNRTPADRQRQWVSRLIASLEMNAPPQDFVRAMERHGVDCLAFSDLSDADWLRIRSLAEVEAVTSAYASFCVDDLYARYFVWDRLVLIGLASNGTVLSHYEDVPDEYGPVPGNDNLFTFRCLRDHARDPEVDGHFFDNGDGYPLSVEKGTETIIVPQDLPDADEISYRQTPMAYALDSLPYQGVDKISTRDSAEENAQVALGDAVLHFPDLEQVQEKVREYCLNPNQIKRKFVGFGQAGYVVSEPHHVEILAAFVASALYQDFPIEEQRVTADGHVQFSVPVALRRPMGEWSP